MEKNLLDTMEGMRGQATFPHLLSVQSDTEVTAHFRIGGVSGPDSDPVTVDVDNAGMLIISHTTMQAELVQCIKRDLLFLFSNRNYRKQQQQQCGIYSSGCIGSCSTIGSDCSYHLSDKIKMEQEKR